MKLIKGLFRDTSPEEQPNQSWIGGKNLILSSKYNEIINEPGVKKLISSYVDHLGELNPGEPAHNDTLEGIVIGIISTPTELVVFQRLITEEDDDTGELEEFYNVNFPVCNKNSEIGIIRGDKYIRVLRANLNLNINFPVFGEAYYNYRDELTVMFSDGYNTPKIINLDNLPFKVSLTVGKDIISDFDLYNIELFSPFKVPDYSLSNVIESGGNLLSGAYYITIQYKLPDESYGNFLHFSNPIIIHNSVSTQDWHFTTGCKPNTKTSKTIQLKIFNLDDRYTQLRFGIIHKSGGTYTGYISEPYDLVQNGVFNIASLDGLEVVELVTLLQKYSYYNKIKNIVNIDNVLYISNLTTTQELRYQKFANNIKVVPIYEDISLNTYSHSHKDPVILFDKKTFMPGEIYAFYIRFHYTDGNRTTPAFHIPGREPTAHELSLITQTGNTGKDIYPNAKYFQFNDTGVSQMGTWINENEFYPSELNKPEEDQEYNGEIDYNGNPITDGINLTGKNVRHHRFKTTNWLSRFGPTPIFKGGVEADNSYKISGDYKYNSELDIIKIGFNTSDIPSDQLSHNKRRFTNRTNSSLPVVFNISSYGVFMGVHVLPNGAIAPRATLANFKVIKSDGFNETTLLDEDSSSLEGGSVLDFSTNDISITLEPEEFIQVIYEITITQSYNQGMISGDSTTLINLYVNVTNTELEGATSGKILGIRLDNIYVPNEIKNLCSHYEILYAERNNDNMSIIGQGVLLPEVNSEMPHEDMPYFEQEYKRFFSYDLLSSKPSVKPTHMINELIFNGYNIGRDFNPDSIQTFSGHYNYKIDNFTYIQRDSDYYEVNNSLKEEHIRLKFTFGEFDHGSIPNPPQLNQKANLGTLVSFKPDVYTNFTNQKLVRTGKLFNINTDSNNIVNTNSHFIFAGDTHLNLVGITQYSHREYPSGSGGNRILGNLVYRLYPMYTVHNVGLRYPGEQINQVFYPYFNFIINRHGPGNLDNAINSTDTNDLITIHGIVGKVNTYMGLDQLVKDRLWDKIRDIFDYFLSDRDLGFYMMPEWYPDLQDYNAINNIESIIKFNANNNFTDRFPYRIHRSLKQGSESKFQNWRVFKPDEYFESAFNKGEIIQLSTDGKDLLMHHKYSLFVARNIQELQMSENVVSALGDSEIFKTRPIEITYDKSGYVGCQSKFGVLPFKYGVLIVDRQQGKIFIYNNLKIEEISTQGLENFFRDNLQFSKDILDLYEYHWQDGELMLWQDGQVIEYADPTIDTKLNIDNPYTQFGIITSWDDVNERVLITKVYNQDQGISKDSFTISYYPEIKIWGFFHDYLPHFSVHNRYGLYHLRDNNIYKANDFTNRTTYFSKGYSLNEITQEEYDDLSVGDLYLDCIIIKKEDNKLTIFSPDYAIYQAGGNWDYANFSAISYSHGVGYMSIANWRLPTPLELQTIRYNIYSGNNTIPPLQELIEDGFHWTNEESGNSATGSNMDSFNLVSANKETIGLSRPVSEINVVQHVENKKPFYIDVVFNVPIGEEKLFQVITWLTKVKFNNKVQDNTTFTKAVVFNSLRYSEDIPLDPDPKSDGFNIRRTGNVWKLSAFRDKLNKTEDYDYEVVDPKDIDILKVPNAEDIAVDWYNHNLFTDSYIIVRFIGDIDNNGKEVDFMIFELGCISNKVTR